MNIKKFTKKDRYGNMTSFEFDTPEVSANVPPMNMIPQYEARGGEADNHPGEPKGSDTVPAWLTPGEFVVNKEATDLFGPQIKQMNDIGRAIQNGIPPMYAQVGNPVNKPIGFNLGATYQHAMENPNRFRNNFDFNKINPKSFNKINEFQELINLYAGKYNLSPNYLKSVLFAESAGKADAKGDKNLGQGKEAHGLGQIRKKAYDDLVKDFPKTYKYTWEEVQNDPAANIDTAARYLAHARDKYMQNIKDQANKSSESFGNLMKGIPPQHYMYQFYNAGPYSKSAEAALNANKVMAIKSYLDSLPGGSVDSIPSNTNVDAGILSKISKLNPVNTFMEWLDKNNKPIPSMPEVPIPKPFIPSIADMNEQGTRNPNITPNPNTSRGESQNWNKGGAVHLDPGGKVWGLNDNKEENNKEEIKEKSIMDIIFPEDYVHKEILPPLGRPNYDEAINIDPSQYDTVTSSSMPGDSLSSKLSNEIPFGTIDDMPQGPDYYESLSPLEKGLYKIGLLKEGNFKGVPKRSNLPVPKDFYGDYGKDLYRLQNQPLSYDPQGVGGEEEPLTYGTKDGDITESKYGAGNFGKPKEKPRSTSLIERDLNTLNQKKATLLKRIEQPLSRYVTLKHKDRWRAQLTELEKEQEALEKELAYSKNYNDMLPTWKKLEEEADLKNRKVELQKLLKESKTISEKNYFANEIEKIDAQLSKLDPAASKEKNIEKISKEINSSIEKDLNKDLNSDKGKAATENSLSNQGNVSKAEGMLKSFFGDLINEKELARAVAVYLGSRALGYGHGDSISYVAKQYIKNVDAKNTAWDKWMLENAHKFEKESIAEFKRTGDPSVLKPKLSAPRLQSTEPKLWFSKKYPKGKYAWEFKIAGPGGKDIGFWAYDQLGQDMVKDAHTDARRIAGQPENDELIAKQSEMVLKILKSEEARIDRTKVRMENNVKKWDQITNLNLASTAWDIAEWAYQNDITDMRQLNSGILTAYAMAVQESKKTGVKVGNIIPFLEEALIKPRLIEEAAELVSAPVGDKLVTMDPKDLVNINKKARITSDAMNMSTSEFWEWARKQWTSVENKFYKENDKTYKEHYQEVAKKKENAGHTPFALFILRIATINGV